jgi:hypothetical protein
LNAFVGRFCDGQMKDSQPSNANGGNAQSLRLDRRKLAQNLDLPFHPTLNVSSLSRSIPPQSKSLSTAEDAHVLGAYSDGPRRPYTLFMCGVTEDASASLTSAAETTRRRVMLLLFVVAALPAVAPRSSAAAATTGAGMLLKAKDVAVTPVATDAARFGGW